LAIAAMPPMKVPQMPRMWRCALIGAVRDRCRILCEALPPTESIGSLGYIRVGG